MKFLAECSVEEPAKDIYISYMKEPYKKCITYHSELLLVITQFVLGQFVTFEILIQSETRR